MKNIPTHPKQIINSTFEGSSEAILVMQKAGSEIEQLWTDMTAFEKRVTTKNINVFLENHAQVVLCRFFDSETHAAVQFISATEFQAE